MSYDQQLADVLRENARLRWFEERYELKCKVIAKQDDEIEQLRAEIQRALDHHDMRGELYTNDADVAAGMADILRSALENARKEAEPDGDDYADRAEWKARR